MDPVFPYSGGKRKLLKYILPVIPAHDTYIEPFAGGLAVFLAKERVKNEIINDLNHEVGTFYLYVREHPESLLREMEDYLHSPDIFKAFLCNNGLTELQRVARWFLLKVSSFAGFGRTFARSRERYDGFRKERHLPLIEELHERLRNVTIDCQDWQKVVDFYDAENAFIYAGMISRNDAIVIEDPLIEQVNTLWRKTVYKVNLDGSAPTVAPFTDGLLTDGSLNEIQDETGTTPDPPDEDPPDSPS